MKEVQRKFRFVALTSVVLALMGFQMAGFQMTLTGAARTFGMQEAGIGLLVALRGLGMMLSPLICGILADRKGKKPILLLSSLLVVLGALAAALAPTVLIYGLGVFLMSAGNSTNESICSAAISDLYPEKSNQMLSLTQFFYNVGGVLGPLMIQYSMEHFGLPWQGLFAIYGAAFLLCLYPLVRVQLPTPAEEIRTEKAAVGPVNFLKSRTFLLLLVGVFFYIGLDHSTGSFLSTLFDTRLRASDWSAYAISVFWAGAALSRLLVGLRPVDTSKLMIVCFGVAAAALLGLSLSESPALSLVLCFAASMSFGPLWTCFLSRAAAEFPRQSASAIGIMSTGSGIGSMLCPMLVGIMADTLDISAAFLVLSVAAVLGTLIVVRLSATVRKVRSAA